LEEWEKQAIIAFHLKNPLEGYRRLTFMMLDADIVAVSPASVWRDERIKHGPRTTGIIFECAAFHPQSNAGYANYALTHLQVLRWR
jgi:hypothetical protein